VPPALFEEWAKKDPILRFERFLESRRLLDGGQKARLEAECREEAMAAGREAEAVERPALETIFTDVYAELPNHLREQGQAAFELARRKGDASAGDGKFPL
jgi:TPP-dependent pyruvate/acetoin dehydrogenase alpha subunit